jgi:diaminohydroxyphosphoribosylaminopyrimidine deaminase/5-amino-6-(5-phosphoribosylamino)uracil reductase
MSETGSTTLWEAPMRRALALAARAWGETHPNPMVGAVVVEDGRIVAEGWHARAGGAHAEVAALGALGRPPGPDATLVVTLEPCSTQGRTPPCVEAILGAGLRRVVVGAVDPNPAHAGRGLARLREAGVEVISGVLASECADLNLIFNHVIVKRRPLVAAKIATTLDGRIAARTGESKWITGEAARADVARWRRLFPAIAVGAGTVAADDPRLTARGPWGEWCPRRLVFDTRLLTAELRPPPHLYTDDHRERTVVVTGEDAPDRDVAVLEALGVTVWRLPAVDGSVAPEAWAAQCAAEGIVGVLVEGGARLLGGLLARRAVDYLLAYRAPLLLADAEAIPLATGLRVESLRQGIRLREVRHETFGDDALMRGAVVYPEALARDPADDDGARLRHSHE